MPAPKTRAGKVMAWALGLAGGATLFSSQADARRWCDNGTGIQC